MLSRGKTVMKDKDKKYIESLKKPGIHYVGSPATNGFTYNKGDVVWVMAGRYWETTVPTKATVRETTRVACDCSDQFCLLLDGVDNGAGTGYQCADHVFYVKKHAVKQATLLAAIRTNRDLDEAHQIVERMLEDKNNDNDEKSLAEYLDIS